jgi:tRNA pseudouridine38-40 synthase
MIIIFERKIRYLRSCKNTFKDRFSNFFRGIIVNFPKIFFSRINYICRKKYLKTRYFIFLSYKGTSFHGWQYQPDSASIQETVDNALSTILHESVNTTGAGRTDAGVHALFFCAHFDSMSDNLESDKKLLFRLNGFLPKDISVSGICKVLPDAHARFSAVSRTYKYYLSRLKDPFMKDFSWYMHGSLDIDIMNRACDILISHTDFTSFSRLHSDNKTSLCNIYEASWEQKDNVLVFTIRADRFLRNMVRAIVGTIIRTGSGKLSLEEFKAITEAGNRGRAGQSAPARGLFLAGIEYPPGIFLTNPDHSRFPRNVLPGHTAFQDL